jgi:FOG: CBS domain
VNEPHAPRQVPVEAELIALAIVPHVVAEGVTPALGPGEAVLTAAALLATARAEAVAVVGADATYLGLVGLRDVVRAAAAGALQAPVAEVMQPRHDWLLPDDTPLDALELFRARGVEHLPVLAAAEGDGGGEPGRLIGIVSLGQLVRLLHRQFESLSMQRQRQIFGVSTDDEAR